MILPDVNVLVYAYRREAERHDDYAAWLRQVVAGAEELALVDVVLTGFVRVVTNPRILAEPAPTTAALTFVNVLRSAPRVRWLAPSSAAWATFAELSTADEMVRANLVPDAWLAALAISHGCRLATADRGFARFARLDFFDPVSSARG